MGHNFRVLLVELAHIKQALALVPVLHARLDMSAPQLQQPLHVQVVTTLKKVQQLVCLVLVDIVVTMLVNFRHSALLVLIVVIAVQHVQAVLKDINAQMLA